MTKEDLIQKFPTKRIEPVDGMAVTADIWREAHEYHRQQQRFHALLSHGSGVVTGLEVIASDPPDSSVYIMPGIAIDTQGQTIVLPEALAYEIGRSRGTLYLLLTYGESRPKADKGRGDGPMYVHAQFGIEAVSALPDSPYVELARIRRQEREAPIVNAKDPLFPSLNEIDLRFRQEIGVVPQEATRLAVSYVGGPESREHGRGVTYLARALRQAGQGVWVDDGIPLASGLEDYALVYLVGQDAFQLERDEMNAVYAYLQGGGTVLVESCRRAISAGDPPADASFFELLASMGLQLEELPPDHALLLDPFLFSQPPPGFETEGAPQLSIGEGVIFSTHDYGCLWRGQRRGRAATREEIRTAMEWGSNVVAYASARHSRRMDRSEGG